MDGSRAQGPAPVVGTGGVILRRKARFNESDFS